MATEKMNEKIQQAIEENLPGMVGKELKDVLIHYEQLKTEVVSLKDSNAELIKAHRDIKNLDRKYDENESRAKTLDAQEIDLKARELLLEFKEKEWSMRLGDIKELTRTVFQSNRFNYDVGLSRSEYESPCPANNHYGKTVTTTIAGKVEGDK